VDPAEFAELEDEARALGFAGVLSGPLVRSSYRAGRLYQAAVAQAGPSRATAPAGVPDVPSFEMEEPS
jgi:lipoic acid synthetase